MNGEKSELTQALGYVRVSTENQLEGAGLDIQKESIRRYARERGMIVPSFFSDEGVSGTIKERPGLVCLLNAIDVGQIKNVIVYKEDRLSRDLGVALWCEFEFEKRGVKLHCSAEPNFDRPQDPMQKAFRHIKNVFAELEKDMITMRLKSGRMAKAEQGRFAGGRPPYGYKVIDGDLVMDERDIARVKQIFEWRRARWSMLKIARNLNAQNIPAANDGDWYPSAVLYILRNPIYRGKIRYCGMVRKGVHVCIN